MNLTKNITFCITHGRTATTFVTQLFTLFDETRSEHEPEPNFAGLFPQVKQDPRHAVNFLKKKIEDIEGSKEKNYVETSNVFGKGYFIPWIRTTGHFPNLLFLNRPFRKVASSLYKRGSIPERSRNGKLFSCSTDAPGTLPVFGASDLSDYQICYWAVLDAYRRQVQAKTIYDRHGFDSRYVWCTPELFHEFDFLKQCGKQFGLSFKDEKKSKAQHAEYAGTIFNKNPDRQVEEVENIDNQEAVVIDRAAYYDFVFIEQVLESEFLDPEVARKFRQD